MGKTSKPVTILVLDADLYNSAEVQALVEKGHDVSVGAELKGFLDSWGLIIGRRCWYMDTKHLKYLDKIAIPAARKRQSNREGEK